MASAGFRQLTYKHKFTSLASHGATVGVLWQITDESFDQGFILRYLMEHLDQGVWDYNVLTGQFVFSKGWCRLRGFPDDHVVDLQKDDWLQDVHPDDRQRLKMALDGSMKVDKNLEVQYRHKHSEGHWVWISCRASVVLCDVSGRPIRIIGTDTDISETMESKESISQLSGKLKLAVALSRMGIFEFDPDAGTVHWDDQMLEIYGVAGSGNLRANELWEDFLHPDDKEETVAYADECRMLGKDFKRDYRIVRPDGKVRHIRSLFQSVEVPNGSPRLVGVNIDVTEDYKRTQELEIARAQLEYDALHDKLTGLGNRRALDQDAEALFNSVASNQQYAVMHIDLDFFKQVNDTLGHGAGDQVLATVGKVLPRLVGEAGTAYRLGGDEFGVLFKVSPDEEVLKELSGQIIAEIGAPIDFEGERCSVGASIGYAVETGPPELQSAFFSKADTALYAAKRAGRNRFFAYSDDIGKSFQLHYAARKGLDEALCEDQMICVLQPQFDAKTFRIVGAEALVRWKCPERGMLPPDQFLPEAIDAGLIAEIDHAVFMRVLALQTQWCNEGLVYPRVSVNVSRTRLEQRTLLGQTSKALKEHHKISFELLETSFYDSPTTELLFTLDALRELNIRVDMDDFGTGHASVRALQALQPDAVKIDRSLVAPLGERSGQMEILQKLSAIARLERAEVLVEGLETGAHMAAIRMLDCDTLQGYVLQKPMSEIEFSALLRAKSHRIAS